jgi:hypothetical protein
VDRRASKVTASTQAEPEVSLDVDLALESDDEHQHRDDGLPSVLHRSCLRA